MGENFKKLKRRYIYSAIIKSVVCGVAFGLFAMGAVMLALKLSAREAQTYLYVLTAVGGAILCGGVCFAFFKPSDKSVARSLDERYALGERAQTALQYSGKDGVIVEIQRADAETRLSALPSPSGAAAAKLWFLQAWKFILVLLIGAGLLIAAFITPAKASVYDPKFSVSEYQVIAVRELIDDVSDSDLAESVKQPAVERLQKLLDDLYAAETQSAMVRAVSGAIEDVKEGISSPLSYRAVSTALGTAGLTYLVRVVRYSVLVYQNYTFDSYDVVKNFGREKINLVISAAVGQFERYHTSLAADEDESEAEKCLAAANTISGALVISAVDESDALVTAFRAFAADISDYSGEAGGLNEDEAHSALQRIFDVAETSVSEAIAAQAYSLAVARYAEVKLCNTFGLEISPYDPTDGFSDGFTGLGGDSGDPSDDSDPDETQSGGYGTGDTVYGSDDLIYDPDTGDYVTYGQLLDRYYAAMQEYLRGGTLTPEQEATVRAYFATLYSGFDAEN